MGEEDGAPNASSAATNRPPATLAGVVEDHRYEQFFYDDATARQLYQIVDAYERPLLLCNPTLAVLAEEEGREYRLLDRDTRFDFLGGYERFSLTEPHIIRDYDFDAVFVDPPFANVTPDQVARCLRLLGVEKSRPSPAPSNRDGDDGSEGGGGGGDSDGDAAASGVPLWVAYNSRREEKLLEAMNSLDCPDLAPKWRLSYKEGVSDDTQGSIWLYGPERIA